MRKPPTLFDFWGNTVQLGMIALEAQAVIAMRLCGMAGFWSVAKTENARMVSEKSTALARGMIYAGRAAMLGQAPHLVMAAAIRPVRQTTRANSRRLSKRGPKRR